MPPRRSARSAAAAAAAPAAAPATPAFPPLDGFTIALSGKFDSLGHSHSSLEALIRKLGGNASKSVTKATTHVVCTEDDLNHPSAKVAAARAKDLPVLKPSWLLKTDEEQKRLDEDDYSWTSAATKSKASKTKAGDAKVAGTKADDKTDTKTNGTKASGTKANGSAATKKRPIAVAKSDDDGVATTNGQPKTKKAKAAKAKKEDEAKDDADDEPEEEIKQEKVVAEGQFIKKKDAVIPLDDFCPWNSFVVHVDPDSGMIYDAALNQSNSTNNNNKFYRIQVLSQPSSGIYKTWTRWGRVGETGQNATLGNGSLPDAIKQFEKKFKDKSGLSWQNRGDNPKPGKYAFIERSYNEDDSEDEEEGADSVKKEKKDEIPAPECTLEKPVKELMELIFNQQYFQATMSALNYDAQKLPLGKLSKATITRGFQQLKDLAALFDDQSLAASKWDMTYPAATEHLSNLYYSLIPHAFGRNRPPIIRDDNMLKKEIELLESLSDMKEAAEIMKIDRKTKDTVHVLDRQFQGLGLEEMSVLDKTSNEFNLLEKYLNDSRGSTHHINYQVLDIFRIERNGEKQRFDTSPYSKISSDRRLLWHGSRCTNFGGILSQGLRIAPPEAPVSGYMFGKGIYLADMSSKSAGYCAAYNSGGHALLLLCEAELGAPMQELIHANYAAGDDAKAKGMHSTWGQGRTGPSTWMDAGVVHESLKGIKMPDTNSKPGPTSVANAGLYYNEYIVYDVAQVKLRYLLRVKI